MNEQQVKEYNKLIANSLENNKLIANFMGNSWFEINGLNPKGDLKFSHDWNWIMPVVDKIEEINDGMYRVEVKKGVYKEKKYVCEIVTARQNFKRFNVVKCESDNSKLQALFGAIIIFLK